MASSYIPDPGTGGGPCPNGGCGHKDCEQSRKMAATLCGICSLAIGYEKHYYQEKNWTVLVHAVCADEEADAKRYDLVFIAKVQGLLTHMDGLGLEDAEIADMVDSFAKETEPLLRKHRLQLWKLKEELHKHYEMHHETVHEKDENCDCGSWSQIRTFIGVL